MKGFRPRLVILSTILLALLAALWWTGWADLLLQADRLHAAPVIGLCVLGAVVLGWFGRWEDALFLGDLLPYLGLIGTVAGLILAISEHPSLDAAAAIPIARSLIANLFAFSGLFWLRVVSRVCGYHHED